MTRNVWVIKAVTSKINSVPTVGWPTYSLANKIFQADHVKSWKRKPEKAGYCRLGFTYTLDGFERSQLSLSASLVCSKPIQSNVFYLP